MPVSAQTLTGIRERVPKETATWWEGPSLLEYLDNMQALERKIAAPLMMPISAKYRDLGTMIEGKIEAGILDKQKSYLLMPNKETVSVAALYGEQEEEIEGGKAFAGDQVRLRIRGVEEEDILPGYVLCSTKRPVNYVSAFHAQVHILPELKSILSAGYNCVMHVHTAQVEGELTCFFPSEAWLTSCSYIQRTIAQARERYRQKEQKAPRIRDKGTYK